MVIIYHKFIFFYRFFYFHAKILKKEEQQMVFKLDNPRVLRTYTGGENLDVLHGVDTTVWGKHYPEEWIASDTASTGSVMGEGLSCIPAMGGISLRSLISDSPIPSLGSPHVRKFGPRLGVLTKLIDSSERLTIQVHPDKKKAMEYFSSPFGKTECWYILGGAGSYVYAGFREGVTKELWRDLFEKQDVDGLIGCLLKHEVKAGDVVLIPGGLPHAIGADTFLIEIQEPTDYTLRFEKRTPSGAEISDEQCHLGIGFENVFDCCDYTTYTTQSARDGFFLKVREKSNEDGVVITKIVDYQDTECFAMDKAVISKGKSLFLPGTGSFCGIYCYAGKGVVKSEDSFGKIQIGDQFFVPASEKSVVIEATQEKIEVFLIRGPKVV